jgi:hypothetical protein
MRRKYLAGIVQRRQFVEQFLHHSAFPFLSKQKGPTGFARRP